MSISAEDVKKLRDMTGAGMMDAKEALKESDLDFDKAVIYLREKGLADSKKRSGKEANEGTIGDYIHYQQDRAVAGVLVELACETDFVAKSEEFKEAAKQIAMHIAAMKPAYLNIEEVPESKVNEEKDIKHDCANHVLHEKYGHGICLEEQHTLLEDGTVTHYDVFFKEGSKTVKNIPTEELKIITSSHHGHKRKKKK